MYLEAHVPGAAFLGEELSDLSIEGQGRHPLPRGEDFAAAAARAGIGDGVFVVAYDHGGAGGAARLWWLLRHYGHEDVAVLRGGLDAWVGPLRGGEEEIEPREFVARAARRRHGRRGRARGAARASPGLVVVDARSPERYRGEVEPIDPVAGRIPGAVNWFYAEASEPPAEIAEADEIVVVLRLGDHRLRGSLCCSRRRAVPTRGSTRARGATGAPAGSRLKETEAELVAISHPVSETGVETFV